MTGRVLQTLGLETETCVGSRSSGCLASWYIAECQNTPLTEVDMVVDQRR
jgi:hypothetical protein